MYRYSKIKTSEDPQECALITSLWALLTPDSKQVLSITLTVLFSTTVYSGNSHVNIQNFLDKWRNQNRAPGVSLLINTPTYQQFLSSGTTTLNGKTPITSDTLFAVGSITKTFTSAMILKLEAEHKLHIDDTIGQYFPEYPRWKNITIRQLLNMTSGIVNFTVNKQWLASFNNDFKVTWTNEMILNCAYQQKDLFPPGGGWYYSNTGYILLGQIIEKVTHQSLAKCFNSKIFKPLGLKHTFYTNQKYPASLIKKIAHGYNNNQDMAISIIRNDLSNFGAASGAMLMSTSDLESWIHHLLVRQDVIPEKQLRKMITAVATPRSSLDIPNTKSEFGLGICVSSDKEFSTWYSYAGTFPGYGSTFVWIPKYHIMIVTQMNLNKHNGDKTPYPHFESQPLIQGVLKKLMQRR